MAGVLGAAASLAAQSDATPPLEPSAVPDSTSDGGMADAAVVQETLPEPIDAGQIDEVEPDAGVSLPTEPDAGAAPPADGDGGAPLPADADAGSVSDAAVTGDGGVLDESWTPALFGDPTPYTRRPPTNRFLTFEADFKYALVGTGPTRFVNGLRFSVWDYIEFRTQLGPVIIPESLVARFSVGSYRRTGRFGLELGFHKLDFGLRIFPEEGEDRGLNPDVIPSVNGLLALTYDVPIWRIFSLHISARLQQRLQHSIKDIFALELVNPLDETLGQLAVQGSVDITDNLALTVGAAYAQSVTRQSVDDVAKHLRDGTPAPQNPYAPSLHLEEAWDERDPWRATKVTGFCRENNTRTLFLDFMEVGRPGYSTIADRENNCSLSTMAALTYGRTESFDVDLFSALRMWPTPGWLFGAGIRWRIAP